MSSDNSNEPRTKKLKECESEKNMEHSFEENIPSLRDSPKETHDSEEDIFFDCSPLIEHHSPANSDTSQNADVSIQIEDDEVARALQLQMDIEEEEFEATAAGRCAWRGLSLAEISKGCDSPQLPLVTPSENHTVLYKLPWIPGKVPEAYPRNSRRVKDAWDSDHVRMPCSTQSLYAVTNSEGKSVLQDRWELVRDALSKPINTSHELQEAILSYNSKYADRWDFSSLHKFFNEVMEEVESAFFFSDILPNIILLATDLPSIVRSPIPLLRRHRERSLSVSQLQAASLLANAFLCTFPRRNTAQKNSEYANFPDINFNRLFGRGRRSADRNIEKLKCVFNYFRRVCNRTPEGVITFTRRFVERKNIPRWDRSEKSLPQLHITSLGTIEDQGGGMLQVDFANSFVGGGVLGSGCVQEEIRFLICPELILARLFTEELDATEALLVTGCERYSRQRGYADSFVWSGDHVDETPRDASGRRHCAVVAMDALYLRNPELQYSSKFVLRELNKAYVGFRNPDVPVGERLSPVATGNWGCGAFRGKATLKALVQLMAAAETGRNVAYFTFHDDDLRDQIHDVHAFLVERNVTVGRLWRLLCRYHESSYRNGRQTKELYAYLYLAVLEKEKPPAVQTSLEQFQWADSGSTAGHRRSTEPPDDRRPQPRESVREVERAVAGPNVALDSDDLKRALESLADFEDEIPDRVDTSRARPIESVVEPRSRLFDALDACEGRNAHPHARTPSKFLEAFERRRENPDPSRSRENPDSSRSRENLDFSSSQETPGETERCSGGSQPERGNVADRSGTSTPKGNVSERSGTSTPKRRISDYFNMIPKSK